MGFLFKNKEDRIKILTDLIGMLIAFLNKEGKYFRSEATIKNNVEDLENLILNLRNPNKVDEKIADLKKDTLVKELGHFTEENIAWQQKNAKLILKSTPEERELARRKLNDLLLKIEAALKLIQ